MEEKKYSIVGTVTIGTDEYRDLITEKMEAIKERDHYSSKYWDKYNEVSGLEKQIKELEVTIKKYSTFVKQEDVQDKFKLFLVMMQDD